MAMPSTDAQELAKFGYKQELDRSLGLFSSFAAGFSYISIMTGVFELFFFGYLSGGPAFIWTWPAVFVGQFLVALCFAELAGQFPLAGSVYQWSKQIARPFTSFFGGWILTVGSEMCIRDRCFAELAGQYPLAGSVYQWSKQIARPFTSFFGGWILTCLLYTSDAADE